MSVAFYYLKDLHNAACPKVTPQAFWFLGDYIALQDSMKPHHSPSSVHANGRQIQPMCKKNTQ